MDRAHLSGVRVGASRGAVHGASAGHWAPWPLAPVTYELSVFFFLKTEV